jgi:hypothetical protein
MFDIAEIVGQPIWNRKIDIKSILAEDPANTSEDYAAAVAKQIAVLLRSKLPPNMLEYGNEACDEIVLEIIEYMEILEDIVGYTETLEPEDGNSWNSVLESLNHLLSQLYVWADTKQVLLG